MRLQRVLIIDDSEVTRRMHTIFLKPLTDMEFLYADNGREGLTMLQRHDVDLIILDQEMPEMTGLEFLAARRRAPRLLHIPVLVVSSLADTKSVDAVLKAGASGFIAKPFGPEEFYSAIHRAMSSKPNQIVA